MSGFGRMSVKVGWFGSTYPDGTQVALVAAVHELGSAKKGRPPKAFIRPTTIEKKKTWEDLLKNGAKEALEGGKTAYQVLDGFSLRVQGDLHKTLANLGNYAEDDPVVKRRRNRKTPPPNQSTAIMRDTLVLFDTLTGITEQK
jgi:hypothetical protein